MDENKSEKFNIFIIAYNLISALIYGASIISILILGLNLYITLTVLKNDKNNKMEKICLVLEIITGIIILFSFF